MIDSHCHLDFKQFADRQRELIEEAHRAGVHTIINIGVDLPSSQRSIDLAARFDSVYATVGMHPHDADKVDDQTIEQFREMCRNPKVVGIGEIGLDYYRDLSPREVQRKAFKSQLQLASDTKLPVVIHTRESFDESVAIVRDFGSDLNGGVFHCFPGDVDDALEVIELGFMISVGGIITFKNSKMSKVAAEVPLDKILLETDAPYLSPVPNRGKTNQPAYVKFICEKLAELKGISSSEVEKITDRTCRKLFGLVEVFDG